MVFKTPKPVKLKAPKVMSPKKPIEGIIKIAFGVGVITGIANLLK